MDDKNNPGEETPEKCQRINLRGADETEDPIDVVLSFKSPSSPERKNMFLGVLTLMIRNMGLLENLISRPHTFSDVKELCKKWFGLDQDRPPQVDYDGYISDSWNTLLESITDIESIPPSELDKFTRRLEESLEEDADNDGMVSYWGDSDDKEEGEFDEFYERYVRGTLDFDDEDSDDDDAPKTTRVKRVRGEEFPSKAAKEFFGNGHFTNTSKVPYEWPTPQKKKPVKKSTNKKNKRNKKR